MPHTNSEKLSQQTPSPHQDASLSEHGSHPQANQPPTTPPIQTQAPPSQTTQNTHNQKLKTYWMTTLLMALCIGLYIIQVVSGVDPANPTSQDLLNWGANWLFYSFGAEPWRMITSVFLHIGFMHLAFNSYALYLFGQLCEHLLGKWFYLLVFILSGIGGNMLNNSYTTLMLASQGTSPIVPVSAGASGGIMGLGAALIVLAACKAHPPSVRLHLKALLWIMGLNLAFGFMVPGIDNAAHIGGAITGAIMAAIYAGCYRAANQKKTDRKRSLHLAGKFTAILIVFAVWLGGYLVVMTQQGALLVELMVALQGSQ